MIDFLISWLVLSVVVWLTAAIVPGITIRDFGSAIITAGIFGALNWLLGWLLFVLIGIGTLGIGFLLAFLTRLFVNAILLKMTDSFTDRLEVKGFGAAFIGAICIAAFGTLAQYIMQ